MTADMKVKTPKITKIRETTWKVRVNQRWGHDRHTEIRTYRFLCFKQKQAQKEMGRERERKRGRKREKDTHTHTILGGEFSLPEIHVALQSTWKAFYVSLFMGSTSRQPCKQLKN